FRRGKTPLGLDPKDTRAKRALRRVMSKEVPRFGWGVTRLKTALHHQKDIHVTWVGLSSDVTAKDDEPLQRTCMTHQLIDTFQTCGNGNTLRCAMAKVRDDIAKRGPIYSDGQIAQLVEGRPQHLPLLPQVYLQRR